MLTAKTLLHTGLWP